MMSALRSFPFTGSAKRALVVAAFTSAIACSAYGQTYTISTVAGGAPPPTPAPGVNASIGQPLGVATDSRGNVYFTALNCVFKVDTNGVLTRVAGNSRRGYSGDGGPATSAQLNLGDGIPPQGVALDAAGNLYIVDGDNQRIRKVSPGGIITTFAGGGTTGLGDNGPATNAQLKTPTGVAVDSSGNVYIADYNTSVRKVSPGGIITTFAGGGTNGLGDGGPATSAALSLPYGVAVDSNGNLYIADLGNGRVRRVSPSGIINTVAGGGTAGFLTGDGGLATSAQLSAPTGVSVDASGNLYIADGVVRKVSSNGVISTVAGGNVTKPGLGDGGPASGAQFNAFGVAVDGSGNLYIADVADSRIRKVSPNGIMSTVAGNGVGFSAGGSGISPYSGDGGPATSAQISMSSPSFVAADASGNLYVADSGRIRRVSASGIITTVAGNGTSGSSGDGGPAVNAQLRGGAVAVDSSGNLYIAEDARIRKVLPSGVITTVAGNGTTGYSGDGGLAISAQINGPRGVGVDRLGNLYIADTFNGRIRKISTAGIITTVAEVGSEGGMAVDSSGNVYVHSNGALRRVSPDGTITTVISGGLYYGVAVDGSGNVYVDGYFYSVLKLSSDGRIAKIAGNGTCCYSGDDGPATSAQLTATGLAVDAMGRVYVADYYDSAVRLLTPVTPAANLIASGGTPQSAVVCTAFANPLQATVTDSGGNPVPGQTVTFAVPSSGASAVLSSGTATTNASGVASVAATANCSAGTYSVIASTAGLSAPFSLTNTSPSNGNLALGKAATQSSTFPGYPTAVAASAVDGNPDGNFSDGSVTATNLDPSPWWQVDLGASAAVSSIVISNRTDCCGSRLNDFWVFVSDTPFGPTDTPATLQFRAGTFSSHQTTAPNPSTTILAGTQGRYVRVQLTNSNYLSLAEVQVFGAVGAPAPTNVALGKAATQSSTFPGYPTAGAAAAVDGNLDGNFSDGSVTATNLDPSPWWQVDLGASAAVSSIVIWNRTDCCGSRLNDYWVFVSDTPFGPTDTPATLQFRAGTFSSHQITVPNPSFTIITTGAQGRYVRVQLTNPNYLSLAEVQVLGTVGAPAPPNVALGKAATQSSTFPAYATDGARVPGAASAVDGNTDGNFSDGSVTATNLDPNPWWHVDLGASTAVSSIVVWNRTDCCSSRLNDFWVFVSDTPFGPTDTPATLQFRAGTFSSHQTTAPNPSTTIAAGAQGRYVRVQLTSPNYLSLAEVQVFGH